MDGYDGLAGGEPCHLTLTANGANIPGDSTVTSQGRENTIECLSFRFGGSTSAAATGLATGRRRYEPFIIRKRTDRSTPLIFKAMAQNESCAGSFKFFRPNPSGDGTTQQFFTISFTQGAIVSVRQVLPMVLAGADAVPTGLLDEVSIVYGGLTLTWIDGGIEFSDDTGRLR